ncbi:hypothetical protein SLEP1_g11129 [Rubroshorea leprosula]|uniref:Uncharacterized protein n=1 Tax=Rubroshorea leprosula TaxID=152421 RepID=A0AAV5ILN9_9ROSI|nr:hypothetical protein SLEP1_g11129 [Rubroshorea leprosula]
MPLASTRQGRECVLGGGGGAAPPLHLSPHLSFSTLERSTA